MKRGRDDAPDAPQAAQRDPNKRMRSTYEHRGDARAPDGGSGGRGNGTVQVRTLKTERENDPHRLAQRQKQIDYGKNTLGYDRYCAMVPRHKRRKGEHPMTPDKTLNVSKKHFDSMVRRWRQALHDYDPPELVERLRAAEQQAAATPAPATAAVAPVTSDSTQHVPASTDDAFLDPELADLDPSNHTTATANAPSIYDAFNDDEDIPVDYEEDDDDDLL